MEEAVYPENKSNSIRLKWISRISILILFLLGLIVYHSLGIDDMFITLKYAENLASGNGLVYNVGERVQGYTSPLWVLILAGVKKLGGPLPVSAIFLSLLFSAWTCFLVSEVFHRQGMAIAGVLTPFLLMGSQQLLATVGMESWFFLFLGTAATLLLTRGTTRAALASGCVWGLAILARPDCAIGLLLAAGWVSMNREFKRLSFFLGAAVAATVWWYLFAWAYYGNPLPSTLSAKMQQGDALGMGLFSVRFLKVFLEPFTSFPTPFVSPFILVGIWRFVKQKGPGIQLSCFVLIWALLFIVGYYGFLGVAPYPWYNSLPTMAFLLTAAVGLDWLGYALLSFKDRASKARPVFRKVFVTGVIALGLLLVTGGIFAWGKIHRRLSNPVGYPRYHLYRSAAEWVRDNTPEDYRILVEEVGIVGYISQRYIMDPLHLVSLPEPAEFGNAEIFIYCRYNDFHPERLEERFRLIRIFEREGFPTGELWLNKRLLSDDGSGSEGFLKG